MDLDTRKLNKSTGVMHKRVHLLLFLFVFFENVGNSVVKPSDSDLNGVDKTPIIPDWTRTHDLKTKISYHLPSNYDRNSKF